MGAGAGSASSTGWTGDGSGSVAVVLAGTSDSASGGGGGGGGGSGATGLVIGIPGVGRNTGALGRGGTGEGIGTPPMSGLGWVNGRDRRGAGGGVTGSVGASGRSRTSSGPPAVAAGATSTLVAGEEFGAWIEITAAQDPHRALMPTWGTLEGSTRYTASHDGQRTFIVNVPRLLLTSVGVAASVDDEHRAR